jgi:hypothetical protein
MTQHWPGISPALIHGPTVTTSAAKFDQHTTRAEKVMSQKFIHIIISSKNRASKPLL